MDSVSRHRRSRRCDQCSQGSVEGKQGRSETLSSSHSLPRRSEADHREGDDCQETREGSRAGHQGHASEEQARQGDGEEAQGLRRCRAPALSPAPSTTRPYSQSKFKISGPEDKKERLLWLKFSITERDGESRQRRGSICDPAAAKSRSITSLLTGISPTKRCA